MSPTLTLVEFNNNMLQLGLQTAPSWNDRKPEYFDVFIQIFGAESNGGDHFKKNPKVAKMAKKG